MIAADGGVSSIQVGFFRADKTDHFGVADLFALILWDFLVKDDLEGVGTFDVLVGLGRAGADILAEADELIGVGAVPDVFVGKMITELAML